MKCNLEMIILPSIASNELEIPQIILMPRVFAGSLPSISSFSAYGCTSRHESPTALIPGIMNAMNRQKMSPVVDFDNKKQNQKEFKF